MVKPAVVLRLLESLDQNLTFLRSLQSATLHDLTADYIRWNATLHLLQVAIEHVTDICAHLLAGTGLDAPDDNRQLILLAGRARILPYDFAERIAPMTGFRNVVVHEYLTVDPVKVDDMLHNRLDDFEAFKLYVYDYLRREGLVPPVESTDQ
jgi:uncharacterized protein YutE (UPF0331/DUF86 family)